MVFLSLAAVIFFARQLFFSNYHFLMRNKSYLLSQIVSKRKNFSGHYMNIQNLSSFFTQRYDHSGIMSHESVFKPMNNKTESIINDTRPIDVGISNEFIKEQKVFLLWTTRFQHRYDGFINNALKNLCPEKNCFATINRETLKHASAVLFYHWYADFPEGYPLPKWRSQEQHYVFVSQESPIRFDYRLRQFDHFYNLTMTYHSDSDIVKPYGAVTKSTGQKYFNKTKLVDDIKNKKAMVAWFVSHCGAPSRREEYASELRKYIEIDVYGKCGTERCIHLDRNDCFTKVVQTHWFYLAFENSICQDYVTEKLYRILQYNVIPIVMGGADYKKILPPKSFIDVNDFKSPKNLADFLKNISNNIEEYMSYFDWKKDFDIVQTGTTYGLAYCKLCDTVRNVTALSQKSYSSLELIKFWGKQNCDASYMERMVGKLDYL